MPGPRRRRVQTSIEIFRSARAHLIQERHSASPEADSSVDKQLRSASLGSPRRGIWRITECGHLDHPRGLAGELQHLPREFPAAARRATKLSGPGFGNAFSGSRCLYQQYIGSVQHAQAARVPEARLELLEYAADTGYGRSKLVGERICEAAGASGAAVGVLRVGQISADSVNGIWNEKEHVPLLVRSATEVKALPRLYGYEGRCEWMPVDTVGCDSAAARRQARGRRRDLVL